MSKAVSHEPYELPLAGGWNLISLPGAPESPGVEELFRPPLAVDLVMGFQNQDWTTSVRAEDGWTGRLTDLSGGRGYWVHTPVPETLSVSLRKPSRVGPPLALPVDAGWNLIGALDGELRPAGETPSQSGDGSPDRCWASLDWEVAYSFDPGANSWARIIPGCGASGVIRNGRAYWVWAASPGTLSPCSGREPAAVARGSAAS